MRLKLMYEKFFNSKADIILLTFGLVVYSQSSFFDCTYFTSYDFGSQIHLSWDFTALHNLYPYKDIYYPYGFLFYFKNINLFFGLINVFLLPGIFISIYIVLRCLWREHILTYISFLVFFIYIIHFGSISDFTRYGTLLAASIIFAKLFQNTQLCL